MGGGCGGTFFYNDIALVDVYVYKQPGDRAIVLYERGCLRAGEEWVEVNLIPVAGAVVGVAILQVNFISTVLINVKSLES